MGEGLDRMAPSRNLRNQVTGQEQQRLGTEPTIKFQLQAGVGDPRFSLGTLTVKHHSGKI